MESRRDFLKTTAFTLGATFIPSIGNSEPNSEMIVQPNQEVKIENARSHKPSKSRIIIQPHQEIKFEGFRINNPSSSPYQISEMILEEIAFFRAKVSQIQRERDMLRMNFSTGNSDDMPFEFLINQNVVLYANIFGDRPWLKKPNSNRTFDENLVRYKAASHFNDLAKLIIDFYQNNQGAFYDAQKETGIPGRYIAGLAGHESSFGQFIGNYPYIGTAFSHRLRTKDETFWKKDFAVEEINAAIEIFPLHNKDITRVKVSPGLAAGPFQFLLSNYLKGLFISRDGDLPNLYKVDDGVMSASKFLLENGWDGGINKPIQKDDPAWVALQIYNGCINYPAGDHRRDLYPALIRDLSEIVKTNL